MKEPLIETKKSPTPKARNLWGIGALGALICAGLLYGVFTWLPNPVGGGDYARFKTGPLQKLDIMDQAPPQPTQTFTDATGKDVKLSDFRGKVILVNLWATWCAPCVTEMPTLAKLHTSFKDNDFMVIAVSVDREPDKDQAIAELAKLTNNQLTFYHDPRMSIVYPLRARGFPTSILYDRHGKELARLAGEADWHSPQAQALIQAALSEK